MPFKGLISAAREVLQGVIKCGSCLYAHQVFIEADQSIVVATLLNKEKRRKRKRSNKEINKFKRYKVEA